MFKSKTNLINKPYVLIISPFFPPNIGGLETHLRVLTKYLQTQNHKVTVITYKPLTTRVKKYSAYEKKKNLEIRRVWWFGHNYFEKLAPYPALQFLYMVPGLLVYTFYYLLRYGKKIDIIHAHGFIAAFVTRTATLFFKKKSVMSTHYIYNLKEKAILAKIFKWTVLTFDKILVVGGKSKKDLSAGGVAKEKILIYSQWADQKLFKPLNKNRCKQKFNIQNKFVVLFVGRLLEMKGVKVLIKVAKKFSSDVLFVFIGDGPLVDEVKRAVLENGNIRFEGKKGPKELVSYYGASDLVVIPSQSEEGNPLVVPETLSCGRPILSTNKGGITEMLDSSVGIIIEPCVEEIYKKISYLYANPKKLDELTSRCRKYALDRYGEKNARLIESCYQKEVL